MYDNTAKQQLGSEARSVSYVEGRLRLLEEGLSHLAVCLDKHEGTISPVLQPAYPEPMPSPTHSAPVAVPHDGSQLGNRLDALGDRVASVIRSVEKLTARVDL